MNAREPVLPPASRSARLRQMLVSERARIHHGGAQRPVGAHRAGSGLSRPSGASGSRISARSACATTTRSAGPRWWTTLEFMADASDAADPARRRYRLRQLQQRAPPGAEARTARHRRRVHRGQACSRRPTASSTASASRSPRSTSSAARSRPARIHRATQHFSIVARVEALIAGWGMDEALRRAEAYRAGRRRRHPDSQQAVAARRDPCIRARNGLGVRRS